MIRNSPLPARSRTPYGEARVVELCDGTATSAKSSSGRRDSVTSNSCTPRAQQPASYGRARPGGGGRRRPRGPDPALRSSGRSGRRTPGHEATAMSRPAAGPTAPCRRRRPRPTCPGRSRGRIHVRTLGSSTLMRATPLAGQLFVTQCPTYAWPCGRRRRRCLAPAHVVVRDRDQQASRLLTPTSARRSTRRVQLAGASSPGRPGSLAPPPAGARLRRPPSQATNDLVQLLATKSLLREVCPSSIPDGAAILRLRRANCNAYT